MQMDKFTNKAREVITSAQGFAAKNDHQQITPLHLLTSLLDESDGICAHIITLAGGNINAVESTLKDKIDALPKVQVSGGGQIYFSNETLKVLQNASDLAKKAGDSFVAIVNL